MLVLFYPPFRADDETELAALAVDGLMAYADDLASFDDVTLRSAWAEVRREHKFERWPTIRVILDACMRLRGASAPAGALGIPAWAEHWVRAGGGEGRVRSWLKDVNLEIAGSAATLWCRSGFVRDHVANDKAMIEAGIRAAHPSITTVELFARDDPKRRAA